ncbi:hypothetical protein FSP39_025057 [Pinctada imbricata]|uniref:Uncharacterized protein n=1 Tax=Pinctada imbricata TaxID=66713 RepID=A0AA88YBV3_PINIB|nr:hypothetical protein FSP39_025057 [Pinctada imbricata]
MHLIGYPRMQGYDQILDPKCIVICTDKSRRKAVTDINEAKAWFKSKFPNDKFPFDQEYNKIESLLTISEFVLFHSSESTAHCASGGPGIVEWDSDRPVVQAMLVSGCPSFTYSTNRDGSYYNGVKIPLEYLFEKGLLMARLHEQLSKDDEKLRNELFYM